MGNMLVPVACPFVLDTCHMATQGSCAPHPYITEQVWQPAQQAGTHENVTSAKDREDVWKLSLDPRGCRLVQTRLEDATSDDALSALTSALHTHVWEALGSPNANYVIQKCISTLRPHDFQFIIDEILQQGPGAVVVAAQHQYGCRILQRLIEFSAPGQLDALVHHLLGQAAPLCNDMYASYVLQHLLQHGAANHISFLVQQLAKNITTIKANSFSVCILEMALQRAHQRDQLVLARELVAQPNLLLSMSSWRHGCHAAKLALQMVAPQHRKPALSKLQHRRQRLLSSRYGKKLVACVERLLQDDQSEHYA
jgi:hypothetical protein